MKRVSLDINEISDDLYYDLLEEFRRIGGEGYYDNWTIEADKTED